MPTIIGIVFFCCGCYCFFLKEDGLFSLLIIASAFEASSAINIAHRGVQPYYLIAAFIIARALAKWAVGIQWNSSLPHGKWLLLFGLIAISSAFILPVVFSGIPVYDPKIGIDDGFLIRPPLKFGLNNLGQAAFLTFHIATAYSLLALDFSPRRTRKAYEAVFYIISVLVIAQSVSQFTGVSFPDSLIRNNPGYAITTSTFGVSGTRNSGPCAEPSAAGAFLVLFGCGFLAEYLKGHGSIWKVLLAILISGLIASSGSLLTICLISPLMLLRLSPLRSTWHIDLRQLRRYVWISLAILVPMIFVLLSSTFTELLLSLTVSKGDTSSFLHRTASDIFALQLLMQSHWLGVGLGSNRASSLLTTLLSNVGIIGTLAFVIFYFSLLLNLDNEHSWLKWAGFGLVLNLVIGGADVTAPMLWIPILLAIQFRVRNLSASVRQERWVHPIDTLKNQPAMR